MRMGIDSYSTALKLHGLVSVERENNYNFTSEGI